MSTPRRQDDNKWNLLYEFLKITQHGTFTAAALATGVSRPAVSQKVRKLEAILGCPLVERAPGNRHFSLTPHGLKLRELVSALEAGLLTLGVSVVEPDPKSEIESPLEQAQKIQKGIQKLITMLAKD